MLFIFRVDTGSMLNLDTNLALETVAHLKTAIASCCNIPVDKQVLLISGGESLEPEERVCKYSAGSSDSNPIFLYSVSSLESSGPPVTVDSYFERDLQPEVEASLSLPDTHNTVAVRASLAQEYLKVSREQVRLCERQILDQHLQHQGWAAALANLEDIVVALERQRDLFESSYTKRYLSRRDHFRQVIETFDDDLHLLSKIPVLPALYDDPDSGHGSNGLSPDANGSSVLLGQGCGSNKKNLTLLDWINQAGNSTLEQVADSSYRSLEQLDQAFLDTLKQKVTTAIEGANNQQMKEIRGLGERLSGLEHILLEAKKKVTEQQDLAAAFLQNQARASGLKDTSILPDLCASHKQQLLVMMRNHQSIISIRKRCTKAKEELSQNLYTRLKWVMFIQSQMAESGRLLVLYNEELKRLQKRMEVLEQLHLAPSMYLATVLEVVRRRSFSQQYLAKAGMLAAKFGSLHSEEMRAREVFDEKLAKHFLSTMFRGMGDYPPPFATEKPPVFDDKLPKISLQDFQRLQGEFPDIAESLSVPDRNTLSSLLTKSFNQNLTPEEGNALHNLHNLSNKIDIQGDGLGSVSMMNRICGGAENSSNANKKKSRLEALAASRDRDLGPDTDSDQEEEKATKAKANRKLSRSVPSKTELLGTSAKLELAEPELERTGASSSSADPSSSSAANTNSSAAPSSDGSMLRQQWPSQSNDLHQQVEERSPELERLQSLLAQADSRREETETKIGSLLGVSAPLLAALRADLQALRSQVLSDKDDLLGVLADMTGQMIRDMNQLEGAHTSQLQLKEEVQRREQAEAEVEELKERIETELERLSDCNREVEMYRAQLDQISHVMDALAEEKAEERASFQAQLAELEATHANALQQASHSQDLAIQQLTARLQDEQRQLRQQLELEHELEFDAFKQKHATGVLSKSSEMEDELRKCRRRTAEAEETADKLRASIQLLEIAHEEKISEEKARIVQILEAGFNERQKLALNQLEQEMKAKHRGELDSLRESKNEEMCSRLEELRQKLIETSQINLERAREKLEKSWQEKLSQQRQDLQQEFQREREVWTEQKLREIEEVRERVRKKSKMEVENLRSRFRIMQSAANLERSPSVSESELSFEDGRIIPSGAASRDRCYSVGQASKSPRTEAECRLAHERACWEKEREELEGRLAALSTQLQETQQNIQQERDLHATMIEETRMSERLRNSAERQVTFNEAIRKTIDEKDKKVSELEGVISKLRSGGQVSSDLEAQLAETCRKNTQLESELAEVQQRLTGLMVGSIALTSPEDSFRQLQEENQLLKQQLSRSMTSLISSAKVSVSTADKGEVVLVVWSDQHSNYTIYHEGAVLHFLHTDCIEGLGLSLDKGMPRKKYTTAEIIDKEYCQARKSENRFHVPVGTKFYRVKCRPVDRIKTSTLDVL